LNIYENKQRWKLILFIIAILIGAGSLAYTNRLVKELATQERKTVELWAQAMEILIYTEDPNVDLSLPLSVIQNNKTIPVILTDGSGEIIDFSNLDSLRMQNDNFRQKQIDKMKLANDSLVIDLGSNDKNFIYYSDSLILNRLLYFPFIQLAVIMLFILVSYLAFSSSRKAEQNKVWVGLSKETAHQLGTPTSSLNGWVEILKLQQNPSIVDELEKDVKRLEKITERFSKIGSKPVLMSSNLIKLLESSIVYLKSRSSGKVEFVLNFPEESLFLPLNEALFEWVIENVCKNAMDAIEGRGVITLSVHDHVQVVYIDISDNGKGIPKSRYKTVFKPGYTTRERGWGLGLSLSKRIVESYHEGKIFILNSELNTGTTIRIVLKKDGLRA
jgi:signal transduction histidine kinase